MIEYFDTFWAYRTVWEEDDAFLTFGRALVREMDEIWHGRLADEGKRVRPKVRQ